MGEGAKDRILVILAILTVIFLFATLGSCNSAMRQKARGDKEMAARLALEEKVNKFSQVTSALEEKAKANESEAQQAKADLEAAQSALAQEQALNQVLKDQLQSSGKPKEAGRK